MNPTSGGSCRTYADAYSYVSTGPGGSIAAMTTVGCTFNAGARRFTCTFHQSQPQLGCTIDWTQHTDYNSVADFVDEFMGRILAARRFGVPASTSTTCSDPGGTGDTTYTYDGQQRLVRSVLADSSGPGSPTATTTYTAWESRKRPTSAIVSAPGIATTSLTYTYDDSARVTRMVGSQSGGTWSTTTTYDADDIPVFERTEASGLVIDTTFTTTSRKQECQ